MSEQKKLLTVKEMAERLSVPVSWIYSHTRIKGPGSIPRIHCGKYLRFEYDEVIKWLRQKTKEDFDVY